MLHVPFRTSPEAISAVLGKQVDVLFDTVSAVLGQVQSGQLKALAVTGKDRFPAVPNVPAAIEFGVLPGYDVTTWYGFFAPRGTPPAVVAKLNKTINEILTEEAVRERLTKAGVVVQGSTPDAFGKHMAAEFDALERGARGGRHPAAVACMRLRVPAVARSARRPRREAPRWPRESRNTSATRRSISWICSAVQPLAEPLEVDAKLVRAPGRRHHRDHGEGFRPAAAARCGSRRRRTRRR